MPSTSSRVRWPTLGRNRTGYFANAAGSERTRSSITDVGKWLASMVEKAPRRQELLRGRAHEIARLGERGLEFPRTVGEVLLELADDIARTIAHHQGLGAEPHPLEPSHTPALAKQME